jgi:hypothetical protein
MGPFFLTQKGTGAEFVIAQSFAFIYRRNKPSLGLWGFTIQDPRFYELAETGAKIEVDPDVNEVRIGRECFPFTFCKMEKSLTPLGRLARAFTQFGKRVYDVLTSGVARIPGLKPPIYPIKLIDWPGNRPSQGWSGRC